MNSYLRWTLRGIIAAFVSILLAGTATLGAYLYIAPNLPSIDMLKDVELQVPLRVYSADGKLIAEFGEKRRTPLRYDAIPPAMVHAVLAAEDDRFFEHPGVDYQGLLRAAFHLVRTGQKGQGGSTITMQVARNFFLSSEKTYLRKLSEIFLALKIESELTKEEILELYLNKIYLGQRAYGVGAAAQVYYGRDIAELEVPQLAMIAGLPKAPSRFNPVVNPERAKLRRDYVLRRMQELDFLSEEDYHAYVTTPVTASLHSSLVEAEAPYVAEMVRAEMVSRFGEATYTAGYRVDTTVDSRLQTAANLALRKTLLEYDRRHGYRGPEAKVEVPPQVLADALAETDPNPADTAAKSDTSAPAPNAPEAEQEAEPEAVQPRGSAAIVELLKPYSTVGGLEPALVAAVGEQSATVFTATGERLEIPWEGLSWAKPYLDENYTGAAPKKAADVVSPGDIIRVERTEEGVLLARVPAVGGALVSLRPDDGALLALVGGFDFYASKFNRVTQAERQPGSNFKPFIYSAALENGFTTASIINDAPVVFEDAELEAEWRPENYSGRFYGPTRLREALINSRNLVSIRLLRAMGINAAVGHVAKFGFEPRRLARDLSLSLGSSALTPLEIVRGYAVLANGGFLVEPYFIARMADKDGNDLFTANPPVACLPCEQAGPEAQQADVASADAMGPVQPEPVWAKRTVEARNVYLVTSMMQDVIRHGTGRRALALGRNDLAGKTGTTNEQRDAWFSGFNRDVVATAWVGFDTPHPLGSREAGSSAALPMWIDYMQVALQGMPEHRLEQPAGLVTVRIDAETGLLARAGDENAMFETFRAENVPEQYSVPVHAGIEGGEAPGGGLTEQLF